MPTEGRASSSLCLRRRSRRCVIARSVSVYGHAPRNHAVRWRSTCRVGRACDAGMPSRGSRRCRGRPPCVARSTFILWAAEPTIPASSSYSPRMRTRRLLGTRIQSGCAESASIAAARLAPMWVRECARPSVGAGKKRICEGSQTVPGCTGGSIPGSRLVVSRPPAPSAYRARERCRHTSIVPLRCPRRAGLLATAVSLCRPNRAPPAPPGGRARRRACTAAQPSQGPWARLRRTRMSQPRL